MFGYYVLSIISLCIFLGNFFPLNQSQSNSFPPPQRIRNMFFDLNMTYKPVVDKIILMVIDAVRTDFVTEENMPYLVSSAWKNGCFMEVNVKSPTVTLPRIKALMTGSVPQFIDVILNLGSSQVLHDSFIHKAIDRGKKVVFYGDDTWLKLFPNSFVRSEGTRSFYVNDFSEVDCNVTRHLDEELDRFDWDIMILHYLGLDHIGHVFGPQSKLMTPKLIEMDKVIKQIHSKIKLKNENVLIFVTGDHGMKDNGGHGGSSYAETHVPLVVLGSSCIDNATVAQTDVSVTLSALMGLEIPGNSVGKIIGGLFHTYSLNDFLYVLMYNALVLKQKCEEFNSILELASDVHYKYLQSNDSKKGYEAQELYLKYLTKTSEFLITSSTEHDLHAILIAFVTIVVCFTKIIFYYLLDVKTNFLSLKFDHVPLIAILLFQLLNSQFSILTVFLLVLIKINFIRNFSFAKKIASCDDFKLFMVLANVLHSISFLSSSFIEEEHQFWYFFASTFLLFNVLLNVKSMRQSLQYLLLFCGLRFIRKLNQTGDKFAHLPDLAKWLLIEENYLYFQTLFIVSLLLVCLCCHHMCNRKDILLLNIWILTLIYIFKSYFANSVHLGQLIWLSIISNLIFGFLLKISFVNSWILMCCLLMRPYNIILLPACVGASVILKRNIKQIEVLTLAHICLANTLYFCQGHSNSLASVNVASGFIGLREYYPVIVIFQVLCHTYAFPILSFGLLIKNNEQNVYNIWTVTIIARLLALIVTCGVAIAQRHHIFIWSVFSPKLLIESSHCLILLVGIILYYSYSFLNKHIIYYIVLILTYKRMPTSNLLVCPEVGRTVATFFPSN